MSLVQCSCRCRAACIARNRSSVPTGHVCALVHWLTHILQTAKLMAEGAQQQLGLRHTTFGALAEKWTRQRSPRKFANAPGHASLWIRAPANLGLVAQASRESGCIGVCQQKQISSGLACQVALVPPSDLATFREQHADREVKAASYRKSIAAIITHSLRARPCQQCTVRQEKTVLVASLAKSTHAVQPTA